jgi:PAS domain S-box-containing protein
MSPPRSPGHSSIAPPPDAGVRQAVAPVATAGVIAFLVLVGILDAWSTRRVYLATSRVIHTYQVQGRVAELLATLVDAETGQRGFIVTDAPRYLEPYERATARIAGELDDLRRLTADNPAQQEDLRAVDVLARQELDELQATNALRRDAGFEAARARVLTDAGKRAMDGMRAIVTRMIARETALLSARTEAERGSYRAALATGAASTGAAVAALVALFISVRRRAADRQRSLIAVAAQREFLEVTLLGIGDAVVVADRAGRVTLMNPVAELLTGHRLAQAADHPIREVFRIVNEETRAIVDSPAERALATGTTQGLANHTVLISADGTERAIDDSAAPIRNPAGEMVGVVLIFRDVSEQRRAAIALEAAFREADESRARLEAQEIDLRSALRVKDEFLAVVSHELRTPINAVVGWSHMLQSGSVREDRTATAIASIDRNARSLAKMIEDLLDTSRLFAGKMQLSLSELDLRALTLDAVDTVRLSAESKGIALAAETPAQVPPVLGDRDRLNQVIWNLLANAIKFTPAAGRVDVALRAEDRVVRLEIRDSGIGIDPQLQPHIFERFYQADSSHARTGLGLGLAISHHLIELHGGTIRVESDGLGRGAAFVVRLPVAEATGGGVRAD